MRHFRVFLSSPGDVEGERQTAHQILLTLPEEPAWQGKLSIHVVRWDNPRSPTPMYANYTPQEAVNRNLPKPSECDLVVLLLWSRFGTPLAVPLKSDGSRYLSGTEWEYENALAASVPVLLYRRTDDPQASLRDPDVAEKQRQLALVDAFFERFDGPQGAATGGYIRYNVANFETLFRRVLESALRQFIEAEQPSPAPSGALEIIERLTRQLEETARENARLREMLVLREAPAARVEGGQPAPHPGQAQGSLEVGVTHTDTKRARTLSRENDVVAVAPVIPLKLVAPLDVPGELDLTRAHWGVSAVGADSSPFTGDGVVVAILDTGIDATHWAFNGIELVQKDFTGEGIEDRNGHGTHFAGTVFGRDVNGNRIGIARGVKKAIIAKIVGTHGGTSDALVSAVQWAVEQGADLIAMSVAFDVLMFERELLLSGLGPELVHLRVLQAYTANAKLFERVVALVRAMGSLSRILTIIAAAGNDSHREISDGAEAAVSLPAATEGIVSVAALTRTPNGLMVAPFSNSGALLSAPGLTILSAESAGGLVALSGTSMAAAHAVGVAALWVEKLRAAGKLTGPHLMSRIMASATREGLHDGVDPVDVGAGLIRAPQS